MFEVKNVSKRYVNFTKKKFLKKEVEVKVAVNNISLKVEEGKIVGVLGGNGAGKTTLIKMMSTLLLPDSGKIMMDNKDINVDVNLSRKQLNMISGGERNLYWRLSALENLYYFGALYEIPKNEVIIRSERLLKKMGLWEHRNTPVERYSKGMKQRLQIAKGLINDPKYLFLDEPTLGLDVEISRDLRNMIKEIAHHEGKGIVLTTHYMTEAEELCDYIYIVDEGKVIISGTKEELLNKLQLKKEVQIEVGSKISSELVAKLEKLYTYSISNLQNGNKIIRLESEKPNLQVIIEELNSLHVDILEIKINTPTLENILITARKLNRK